MKVAEWIRMHPGQAVTVDPGSSLAQVLDRMLEEECLRDMYVVSDEGRVLGHLSRKKIVRLFLSEHQPSHTRRQLMERVAGVLSEELMDSDFVCARPEESLDDVLQHQVEHDIDDMLVVDGEGRMTGVVNIIAVLEHMRKEEDSQ